MKTPVLTNELKREIREALDSFGEPRAETFQTESGGQAQLVTFLTFPALGPTKKSFRLVGHHHSTIMAEAKGPDALSADDAAQLIGNHCSGYRVDRRGRALLIEDVTSDLSAVDCFDLVRSLSNKCDLYGPGNGRVTSQLIRSIAQVALIGKAKV
jgi:hypothetical protein